MAGVLSIPRRPFDDDSRSESNENKKKQRSDSPDKSEMVKLKWPRNALRFKRVQEPIFTAAGDLERSLLDVDSSGSAADTVP
jgi:hypothetical protein